MCELMNGYNRYHKIKKSSSKTIKTYKEGLKDFFGFVGIDRDNIANEDILGLDKDTFGEYLIDLENRNLASSTKIGRFNAIKDFLSFFDEDVKEIDLILAGLKKIRKKIKADKNKKPQEYLTEEESILLLNEVRKESGNNRKRNILIFTIFLHLGLRLEEIQSLKHKHFDIKNNMLNVYGKGDKLRLMQLNPELINLYYDHIGTNIDLDQEAFVFASNKNNNLSKRQIQKDMKKYLDRCGIDKSIHCHSLRRTYANLVYGSGKCDLIELGASMGHTSSNTTKIYINTTQEMSDKAVGCNPLVGR